MHMTRIFSILSLSLVLWSGFPGNPGSAAAQQQQEKRIALVVGDGAYARSPLATAANDAGLIAQTLQAAGFDVVGARDLDADTLRGSLRDFIQKAQASGPGTIAMIYLSGYGVQLAGENYFIPVDSKLSRDVDIPIEGLRISDYVRQLASLPLKASIVVLDAARQQPFIEGGQPIAGGLALVEPDPHMLIAFNAAPGTVAPNEQGNYGVYAQSLAEMIRTGGLPLSEVFNRVRLRVNDASKGAQVPWDAEKIDAPFMFFDRAPDAPAQAAPDQVAAIRSKPIRDLGVQDAYAAALERDTMPGYEDFLAAYPGDPLARRVRAIVAARREAITWLHSYRTDTPQAYWSYLRRYPRGSHAGDARRRLAILTAPLEPPPAFAVIDYDVPPPPPDEVVYVDRHVLYFSDPDFDFAPPPPPPIFFLPPPPPDFVVLAPPIVAVGLFVLPQPYFVPIPVYCQPPVYVAPPPNNIIFANIHNTTVINNVINQPPAPVAPATAGTPATAGAPTTQPGVSTAATKGGVVTAAATGAQVQLPQTAVKKDLAVKRGDVAVQPSMMINGTAKSAGIANVQSGQKGTTANTSQTNATSSTLPADKTLPGMKGGTTLPTNPSANKSATTNSTTTSSPASPATGAGAVGSPKTLGTTGPVQGATTPNGKPNPEAKSATTTPTTTTSPTGAASGAGAAGGPKTLGTTGPGQGTTVPGGKPTTEPKSATTTTSPTGAASGAGAGPKLLDKRKDVVPPPPPSAKPAAPALKPTPPVAHVEPAHRAAPPPPPPPHPAQIARPAPPPPPRPAPQIARPAPPPPHPVAQAVRPAPPPPPRPAPPPARPAPAAAKKCPPNVPRC